MLQFISSLLNRFRREDEEGQTLVEYGLLLALIAIIVIVALIFLGPIVSLIFHKVGTNLQRYLLAPWYFPPVPLRPCSFS